MKSRHVLAVVLILIAIGSWVYVTRPARQAPAPANLNSKFIPPSPVPSSMIQKMEDADKRDALHMTPQEKKQLQAKIAKLKNQQKVVNGMIKVRADELPKTIVLTGTADHWQGDPNPDGSCPTDTFNIDWWEVSKGGSLLAKYYYDTSDPGSAEDLRNGWESSATHTSYTGSFTGENDGTWCSVTLKVTETLTIPADTAVGTYTYSTSPLGDGAAVSYFEITAH